MRTHFAAVFQRSCFLGADQKERTLWERDWGLGEIHGSAHVHESNTFSPFLAVTQARLI